MRTIFFVIALSAAGCATTSGPRPVNVATVRHEIDDSMHGERKIYSMGHVEAAKAVVYTEGKDGGKHEETWVKSDGAWKQEGSTALSGSPSAASAN